MIATHWSNNIESPRGTGFYKTLKPESRQVNFAKRGLNVRYTHYNNDMASPGGTGFYKTLISEGEGMT